MRHLSILLLSLSFAACSADVAEPEITHIDPNELSAEVSKADGAGRRVAVAHIAENGRIVLHRNRLSRSFPDGGEIERFAVARLEDGLNLLRFGTAATGENRTDTIPLAQVGGRIVIGNLKWIVACMPVECTEDSGHDGFCSPNYEKTDCFCASGKQCRFGIDDVPYDTVTVGNSSYP